MRRTLTILTFALVISSASSAFAQSLQSAQALFDQGKWQEAATAAAALNTSAGLALAAEATTAGAGMVADNQKKALFAKAQDYAKQAIAKDANNADAYFELARAQGRFAQTENPLSQINLAKEMKANLDKALQLNSKMAGAYVALGLWNATLDAGGIKGAVAAAATGAKKANVVPNFKRAIELEPTVAIHRIEYVNALQLMGSKDKAFMVGQLQRAMAIPASTYWEKQDLENAKAMLAKLK